MITDEVYNEVMEGKDKQLFDALLLERLVEEKKIAVEHQLNKDCVQKIILDFGAGMGEAESLALALTTKDKIIVTDNKQGRKVAKIQGLNLLGSIDVVVALRKTGKISKEKALQALHILKKEGWFQEYLLEKAMEDISHA